MRLLANILIGGCLLFQVESLIAKGGYNVLDEEPLTKYTYLREKYDSAEKLLEKIVKLQSKLATYEFVDLHALKNKSNMVARVLFDVNNLIEKRQDIILNDSFFNKPRHLAGPKDVSFVPSAVCPTAAGLNAVANAFGGTLAVHSTSGHIEGPVNAVPYVNSVGDAYEVAVKVGDQIFLGVGVRPIAGGIMSLISHSHSVLSLDFDNSVTAITNEVTFTSALKSLLGLDDDMATVKFKSASAWIGRLADGFPRKAPRYKFSELSKVGKYALSYDGKGMFTLIGPDGNKYIQMVTSAGAQEINFSNVMKFSLGSSFILTNSKPQFLLEVTSSDKDYFENDDSEAFQKWLSSLNGKFMTFLKKIQKNHGLEDYHATQKWTNTYFLNGKVISDLGMDETLLSKVQLFLRDHLNIYTQID